MQSFKCVDLRLLNCTPTYFTVKLAQKNFEMFFIMLCGMMKWFYFF